jgi:hypothetical protein
MYNLVPNRKKHSIYTFIGSLLRDFFITSTKHAIQVAKPVQGNFMRVKSPFRRDLQALIYLIAISQKPTYHIDDQAISTFRRCWPTYHGRIRPLLLFPLLRSASRQLLCSALRHCPFATNFNLFQFSFSRRQVRIARDVSICLISSSTFSDLLGSFLLYLSTSTDLCFPSSIFPVTRFPPFCSRLSAALGELPRSFFQRAST